MVVSKILDIYQAIYNTYCRKHCKEPVTENKILS